MGLAEIIFSFFMFCVLWFVVFKFLLIFNNRKLSNARTIEKNLEKQDKKYFTGGKEVNLKKELGLIAEVEPKKPKRRLFGGLLRKRKKKEKETKSPVTPEGIEEEKTPIPPKDATPEPTPEPKPEVIKEDLNKPEVIKENGQKV